MPVHHVERIDIAVLLEVRIKREPEQPVVAVFGDLLANVEHWGRQLHAVLHDPDPSVAVPYI